MKNQISEQVIGIPSTTAAYFFDRSKKRLLADCPTNESSENGPCKISVITRINRLGIFKMDNFAQGIRDHVKLAPKLTETVKGKLSLGAKILQLGGVEKVFKQLFNAENGEKLIKASQCYLSTTIGPIAGLLFLSTEKVSFCSERSIKLLSPTGKLVKIYYKVSIPLRKIKLANASEDAKKPSQKYIEIVTDDNFEFWFMGFVSHKKTFKSLQEILYQ